jgi:hypothetical protein
LTSKGAGLRWSSPQKPVVNKGARGPGAARGVIATVVARDEARVEVQGTWGVEAARAAEERRGDREGLESFFRIYR